MRSRSASLLRFKPSVNSSASASSSFASSPSSSSSYTSSCVRRLSFSSSSSSSSSPSSSFSSSSSSPPIVAFTQPVPSCSPALLRASGCHVRLAPAVAAERALLPKELESHAAGAHVLCFFVPDSITGALLESLAPTLRILASFGKGIDNVDLDAVRKHKLELTHVPLALTDSTADLALALLLALTRRIREADALVREGVWPGWHATRLMGSSSLTGKTLGLVGFGAIGRAIAKRALGFGLSICYCDPIRAEPEVEASLLARGVGLERLLIDSDFVVLALPLTRAAPLIDASRLALMKNTAVLINVARGSLVDENAVAAALDSQRLAGFAADVFACEDRHLVDAPRAIPRALLENTERTLFTPHLGTALHDVRNELALCQARCVLAALRGERPEGRVELHT